ncbi:response regulator transcription factor [Paraburkholderia strydomiana]|uniref:response regulator transcription factor n=1 Tax=Paraburkholderia strydomiana TaxID=1245417 RepID=UPI001BE8E4D3|nr:response regulator [Paraburkholderia strydomiana]MBT2792851.1 response regulator [Paraburkholderia strydomiana]
MATPNLMVAVGDDDASVCRALKRLLHSVGISANTFSSGEAFLEMLSSATSSLPACLIVDFEMPRIDGLKLQRHLAPTGVPIIFVTATQDEAVREKALAQGAAAYLSKPFESAVLIRTVRMALGIPHLPEAL